MTHMSSQYPPPSPKLRPLLEFNEDVKGYIEHVEQYQNYIELKEQLKQIEMNLLIQESPQQSPVLSVEPTSVTGEAPATASQPNLDYFVEEIKFTERKKTLILSDHVKNKNPIVKHENYCKQKLDLMPMPAPMFIKVTEDIISPSLVCRE